jgi:twinkle protein
MKEQLLENGIRLTSYGIGGHKTTCPQCSDQRKNSKDPCLWVTVESELSAVWKCFHCDWVGSVGAHYGRKEQRIYRKPEPIEGTATDKLYGWFFSRGISKETVNTAQIRTVETWMPGCEKGQKTRAIAIPFTRDGEIINVKYRTHDKKFRQEKDAEPIFFGLDSIGDADMVVVTEGEIDALSAWECGFAAISVPDGAPAQVVNPDSTKFDFVGNCIDRLEGKTFVLAVDMDGPGEVLKEELLRRFGKENCRVARYPADCKDLNDVLVKCGSKELKDCIDHAEQVPLDGVQSVDQHTQSIISLYRNGRSRGLSTGWPYLDEHVTVRRGDVWVVTGVPNHGKSEVLDALTVNLAEQHGWTFGIASFENQPDEHAAKWIEKHHREPFWDGPTRKMTEGRLIEGIQWANQHYHYIRMDGDDAPTYQWVIDRAKALVKRNGITGLVVDPYNELESNRGQTSETEFVSQMLRDFRRFAQNYGVTVFIVAHPQKMYRDNSGNYPPPSLYDISGSANWNNKADVGLVVHRNFDRNNTEIFVRKVRRKEIGKAGGSALLKWLPSCGCFDDVNPNLLEGQC